MSQIIKIYNENPNPKEIESCRSFTKGGLIIYPTDTVYGLVVILPIQSA